MRFGSSDQRRRALTGKLMTYAIGRKMTFRDKEAIGIAMAPANGEKEMRFRDLLLNVTLSETFTKR